MINELFEIITEKVLPLYYKYRSRLNILDIKNKNDRSILTEADLIIQKMIIEELIHATPDAGIIAEEKGVNYLDKKLEGNFWVVDPIDGTKEFVKRQGVEFCSVIVCFENYNPIAALLIAPELGKNRSPLIFKAFRSTNEIYINNRLVTLINNSRTPPKYMSITRSCESIKTHIEKEAEQNDRYVKTISTSESLDMLRLVISLTNVSDENLPPFDLFYRENQKLWDGASGFVFTSIAGLEIVDKKGKQILPISKKIFSKAVPEHKSILVGTKANINWFRSFFK